MEENYIAINKKPLIDIRDELYYLSSNILDKLNNDGINKIHEMIIELHTLQKQNCNTLTQEDVNRLEHVTNKFDELSKSMNDVINSIKLKNINNAIQNLKVIPSYAIDLLEHSRELYCDIEQLRNVMGVDFGRLKNDFSSFQTIVESALQKNEKMLLDYENRLGKLDLNRPINQIKKEIMSTFLTVLKDIKKNNIRSEHLGVQNIKAIKEHNQSIKTINIKAISSFFLIGIVIGVLGITTFQVDTLKKVILSKELNDLKRKEVATKKLEKEKLDLSKKYNLSKKVQDFLNSNFEFFQNRGSEFISIRHKHVKKVYKSNANYLIIELN